MNHEAKFDQNCKKTYLAHELTNKGAGPFGVPVRGKTNVNLSKYIKSFS